MLYNLKHQISFYNIRKQILILHPCPHKAPVKSTFYFSQTYKSELSTSHQPFDHHSAVALANKMSLTLFTQLN